MKKNNFLKNITNSPILWIVLSLLIAVFMWTYVASQDTEEFKKTFTGVRVQLVGEDILRNSRNMVITNVSTPTVNVEIVGPRRIVSALDEDDLVAQIDVSKLTLAAVTTQTYKIIFPDGTDTSSLSTLSRTPETVVFTVSELIEKQIPVRGSFEGTSLEGYVAEAPVFTPATITVSGPEIYLKNIKYAWLTFGAGEEVDHTITRTVPFVLRDNNDEDYYNDMISFDTNEIEARLTIIRQKVVPLEVSIEYASGATPDNTKVTIEPGSVTLSGDSELLDAMNQIVLATINTKDFSSSFTETYLIRIDDGLVNQSGVTEAKVTVELSDLVSDKFIIRNIAYINLTEGYEAELITSAITVTLRGPEEQLMALKAENIRAVVDLEDYLNSTGTFNLTPKIYVDGFPDVGEVGEVPQISIALKEAEGNS
jgi:YbbR domain-containing protein